MRSIQQHFSDWEDDTFGYGYGSGEGHVLGALKTFMAAIPEAGGYDYEALEKACSPQVAWLLINVLAHDGKIEYGTSPRFGWLTDQGKALKAFTGRLSVDELTNATAKGDDYVGCAPEHCNCEDEDCRSKNPFWDVKPAANFSRNREQA